MSLLEQKRQQWAAEKEQFCEWNPWGKPGCGAPVVSYTTAMVTNSNDQLSTWQSPGASSTDVSLPLHISCTPNDFGGRADRNRLPPLPPTTVSPSGHRSYAGSMISSLGFNPNPLMYTYAYDMWREDAKKQWLQELEKQREEQRLKKIDKHSEMKTYKSEDILNKSKSHLNDLNSGSFATPLSHENNFSALSVVTHTNSNEQSPISNFEGSVVSWPNNKTYLRGANVPLDPVTQNELSQKRARALEQQEIIRLQIEERQRLKEKEKSEERRRELEEELRISKEIQRSEEPSKTANKQQIDVHEKTAKVTTPLSVSRLPDVLDGTFQDLPKVVATAQVEQKTNEKNTATSSLLPTLPKLESVPVDNQNTYIVNRVLTPTKYRGSIITKRDFSTQTDFSDKGGFPFKKDASTCTKLNGKQNNQNETRLKNGQRGSQKGKTKNLKSSITNNVTDNHNQEMSNLKKTPVCKSKSRMGYDDENTCSSRNSESQTRISRIQRPSGNNISARNNSQLSASRSRSRSSAEYQRMILADEHLKRRSLSPVLPHSRLNVTGDSSTCDEDLSNSSRPARRKRRQWESPGRDEIPHFYTDSPQLPDGRRIRRSKFGIEPKFPINKKEYSNMNISEEHRKTLNDDLKFENTSELKPDETPILFRSDSPPVPALLRLHLQSNTSKPENQMEANFEKQTSSPGLEKHSISWPIHSGESSEYSPVKSRNQMAKNIAGGVDANRDEILRKLTIIRHNLSLKQQEVNQMTSGFDYHTHR